jgi:hypothetical protein
MAAALPTCHRIGPLQLIAPPSAIAFMIEKVGRLQGIGLLVQVKLIGRPLQSSNSEQFETCTLP